MISGARKIDAKPDAVAGDWTGNLLGPKSSLEFITLGNKDMKFFKL